MKNEPDDADLHVGLRVRLRRRALGISQEGLARALGLTFQQIQKYERGANRISASKLYRIAQALSTPVAWFFEGLPDPAGAPPTPADQEAARRDRLLAEAGGVELADAFLALTPPLRRALAAFARGIAEALGPASRPG